MLSARRTKPPQTQVPALLPKNNGASGIAVGKLSPLLGDNLEKYARRPSERRLRDDTNKQGGLSENSATSRQARPQPIISYYNDNQMICQGQL